MIDCSVLKIRDYRLLGSCGCGALYGGCARWGNEVAAPNDNFVNGPLHSVAFWSELALLDGALHEDVVAFGERHGDARKIAVEGQVVPVGVLLRFSIRVLVPVALAESDIGDRRSGRKIPDGGLGR
jgi:hypothetical protein